MLKHIAVMVTVGEYGNCDVFMRVNDGEFEIVGLSLTYNLRTALNMLLMVNRDQRILPENLAAEKAVDDLVNSAMNATKDTVLYGYFSL